MKKMIQCFLVLSFLLTINLISQTVTALDYKVTFVGMTADYTNNTSTWTYTVSTVGSAKDLSHWVLELCPTHTVLSYSPTNLVSIGNDPTTGVYGIKWDAGQVTGTIKTYSFTLSGIYVAGEVKVGVKTKTVGVTNIIGPTCTVQSVKAKIGDKVWIDTNKDGIQDAGETGLSGVTVKLYKCDNTYVASTSTNAQGEYLFSNLTPGDYYIKFDLPATYLVSPANAGSDDAKDSDADPITGKTICTTLSPNETDLTWDLGVYKEPTTPCVTSANVSWAGTNQLCEFNEKYIKVTANVVINPTPSKGTIKYYYKQLAPVAGDPQYTTLEITASRDIEIEGFWPGVKPTDTLVKLEFGVEVYDCNGNKIGTTSTFLVQWDPTVCPPPSPDKPDLKIEKSGNVNSVQNGQEAEFTIKVTNLGPGNATNIRVSDVLPAGLDFISASSADYNSTTGIWTISSLNVNQSTTLTIRTKTNVGNLNNSAFDLGQAKDFNVFVFNNYTQNSGDVEGRMAVGGNATLSGFSVGDKLEVGYNGDVLIVGGNLSYQTGRVFNGNVVFGTSTNLPLGSVSIDGTLRQENVIDFAAAESYLKGLSIQLKDRQANGTAILDWSTIRLTGTDPLLNVFDLDGSLFTQANGTVINVPNGSVVVVNIKGDNLVWYGGLEIHGTSYSNIIYNFYEATKLTIRSMETRGTVLAPLAEFKQEGGFLNGQLICKSVIGATQFNHNPFNGNIPGSKTLVNVASITSFDQTDIILDNNVSGFTLTVTSNVTPGSNQNSEGNWEIQSTLSTGELIWSFAKDKNGKQLLGSVGGNIYRLDGANYTVINTGMGVVYIWAIAVDASGNIYAGTEKGLYVSNDNGISWNNFGLQVDNKYPDVRALVFDKTGNLLAGTWGSGVFKYSNNSWSAMSDSMRTLAVHALAVDSQNNLFVGTFDSGIYRMKTGETYWTKLNVKFEYIWSITVAANDILLAGTYGGGVFMSYDNGNTWVQQNRGLPSHYIYNIQVDNTDIYLSAWASGIYKMQLFGGVILTKSTNSMDIGWNAYGLAGYEVSSLYFDKTTKDLYAGTRDGNVFKFVPSVVGIEDESLPKDFVLEQNYPNPFNPSTKITFSLPVQGMYKMQIINVLGQSVETILNSQLSPGKHTIEFNASKYSSGVYFYRLIGEKVNITRKMMLVK